MEKIIAAGLVFMAILTAGLVFTGNLLNLV
jgi:hypothetical protein